MELVGGRYTWVWAGTRFSNTRFKYSYNLFMKLERTTKVEIKLYIEELFCIKSNTPWLIKTEELTRRCFLKKVFLKYIGKFTGKHLYWRK